MLLFKVNVLGHAVVEKSGTFKTCISIGWIIATIFQIFGTRCFVLQEVFESVVQLDGANYFMCDLEFKKVCFCSCSVSVTFRSPLAALSSFPVPCKKERLFLQQVGRYWERHKSVMIIQLIWLFWPITTNLNKTAGQSELDGIQGGNMPANKSRLVLEKVTRALLTSYRS